MSRVLVIEDERRVLRSLEEGLRAAGFEVEAAATGDEGARLAAALFCRMRFEARN